MIAETVVTVPAGVWLDGKQRRELSLRTLSGEDEAFLINDESAADAFSGLTVRGRVLRRRCTANSSRYVDDGGSNRIREDDEVIVTQPRNGRAGDRGRGCA